MRRVGLVVLALVVLTLPLPPSARAAEEKELAGNGEVFNSGWFSVHGPFHEGAPYGYSFAIRIVPKKTGTPTRIDLAMHRELDQGDVPMRLALHQEADGRPGAIIGVTTVFTKIFPLTNSGFVPVPVTGWPRLQEDVHYWVSARIEKVHSNVRWMHTNATATVPGRRAYELVHADGSKSVWASFPGNGALGIRVFGTPPRRTQLTANPLIAKVSSLQVFLAPSARLVALGPTEPLEGKLIVFFTGTTKICQATTNANGVARCPGTGPLVAAARATGFQAKFAGDPDYNPSSGNAGLVVP